ncbi:MAG TPA: hypothetical protein VGR73_07260 [Bryobacteraceae bacterium]|nr:hypothetical protein [Bryobacteraceae bacterium]
MPAFGLLGIAAIGLLLYSQTRAFTWDTGFHLLAAQLILHGKRPYVDFFFPQTPLNAYWNAAWMRIFGESWRVPQGIAALLTAGATFLAMKFAAARFPVPSWRPLAAFATVVIVAGNQLVALWATSGQAYALCLFAIVAAFYATVESMDREGLWWPALAGFLAGVGAASSLLTAPVGPVLLIWMLVYHNTYQRAGNRWAKGAAFLLAATVPFLPLLWLFLEAPRPVWFNIFEYHFYYRQVAWPHVNEHDLELITGWIESGQALLLMLLAGVGFVFVRKSGWDRERKAEFYLCGWLVVIVTAHLLRARPTFAQYFLLVVPFLGILAVAGLYYLDSKLDASGARRPVFVVLALLGFALARAVYYDTQESYNWAELEEVAKKVVEVTPPGSTLLADEAIYFLTRRAPYPGAEQHDAHKLMLPEAQAASLHVMSQAELEQRIHAGVFNTLETCEDEDEIARLGLEKIYLHKAEAGECEVFWDPRPPQ